MASETSAILVAERLTKTFAAGTERILALDAVDFAIRPAPSPD